VDQADFQGAFEQTGREEVVSYLSGKTLNPFGWFTEGLVEENGNPARTGKHRKKGGENGTGSDKKKNGVPMGQGPIQEGPDTVSASAVMGSPKGQRNEEGGGLGRSLGRENRLKIV